MKILVLGATGMLGSTVFNYLSAFKEYEVSGTSTSRSNDFLYFDVLSSDISELVDEYDPVYIVNCIGKIKPEIDEQNISSRMAAIQVNAVFPHELASIDKKYKVIQIATDCVYTGKLGNYKEIDLHDATDIYGKTKSLGEVNGRNILNLRCSIIGREMASKKSLIEWVLSQPHNAELNGYLDHKWNGVTTLAFAKVVAGVISSRAEYSNDVSYHLVPADIVDKYSLVSSIANNFGREDLRINPSNSPVSIDRTLDTEFTKMNANLWANAGYAQIPTIAEMIKDYADWFTSSQPQP